MSAYERYLFTNEKVSFRIWAFQSNISRSPFPCRMTCRRSYEASTEVRQASWFQMIFLHSCDSLWLVHLTCALLLKLRWRAWTLIKYVFLPYPLGHVHSAKAVQHCARGFYSFAINVSMSINRPRQSSNLQRIWSIFSKCGNAVLE